MTHQRLDLFISHQLDEEAWMLDGICVGENPEHWFPTPGNTAAIEYAVGLCKTCPVRVRCLDFALRSGSEYGVWGATTEAQRRQIKENGDAA